MNAIRPRRASPRPAHPRDGIAWVTGASSGIGLAVAKQLLQEGWTVAVTARSREPLDHLATAHPGRVIVAPGDVTDEAAMREACATARRASGRKIALALLNAGSWHPMGARDFDLANFRQSFEVNVIGTATALAAVMPNMIDRRMGQIAITASVAGYFGMPMATAYGATKAALITMAESLKFDLDRLGVMTNVICPGFVRTPMTDVNKFPMPFIIEAEEAARTITAGLRRGRFEIIFPPAMAITMKLTRLLPYALFFAAIAAVAGGRTAAWGQVRGADTQGPRHAI